MTITLDPDNTLIETELQLYARKHVIQDIHLLEEAEGFIVRVHLTWRPDDLYLATRRDRTQPKLFKSIRPLLDLLRTHAPGITSVIIDLLPAESPAPPALRRRERPTAESPTPSAPRGRGRPRASPDHPEKD